MKNENSQTDSSLFYFLSLVLITTYDCNSKCRHCYPECGPASKIPWDVEFVKKAIDYGKQVPPYALARNVHFAGGEPFLYYNEMIEGFEYAQKNGFYSSVVTNGYWATSVKKAEEKIKPLIELGLSRMELSIDRFHQEFIPLNRVRNALFALRKLGIQVLIRSTTTITNDAYSAIEGISPGELVGTRFVSSAVSPEGRALEAIPADDFIYGPEVRGCCYKLLNLAVKFNGNVSPCCAGSDIIPLLSIGNINKESLVEILEALKQKFHIIALVSRGPAELIKVLEEGGLGSNLRERYTTICHACTHIFSNRENVDYLEEYYRKQKAKQFSDLLTKMMAPAKSD